MLIYLKNLFVNIQFIIFKSITMIIHNSKIDNGSDNIINISDGKIVST